jgi:uncharacterized protein
MDQQEVLKRVGSFPARIQDTFHPGKVFLFGSWSRNEAKEFSDIDVAVIVSEWTGKFMKAQSELFRCASEVDLRIEPILLERNKDKSGFLAEMEKTGIPGNLITDP